MYARNLTKTSVRASPGFMANPYRASLEIKDENSYRNYIPPGYVGNRFRKTEEPRTKHHPPDWDGLPALSPMPSAPVHKEPGRGALFHSEHDSPAEEEQITASLDEAEPVKSAEVVKAGGGSLSVNAALTDLVRLFRDRVSFEDLLLVLLILTLAVDGEQGGETILLLALLLLVK